MTPTMSFTMRNSFLIVFILSLFIASAVSAEPDGPLATAPRFTARDINNRLVCTDSLIVRGPLIIDFWATWCAPCRAELKALQKLVTTYKEKNLTVVAISEDGPSEAARVRQMAMTNRWPFTIVIDNGKSLAEKFNMTAMPTLFLIDGDGKIRWYSRGYVAGDEAKLEKELGNIATGK